jgi:BirA family biotin operon repressor/biotin-[acetyl-CoA-carboxylase] ligase
MKSLDIHNPFNAPVYHEETVTSTMEASRFFAQNGAPHGTVIAADFQEAGRGRILGRHWEMEKGQALAFTILLRFSDAKNIPVAMTLRTGLAVALAIEDFAPALAGKALIKWPNDILLFPAHANKQPALKLVGILTEAEDGNVYIGIGVNVSQKQLPVFLHNKATSLSIASGMDYDSEERYKLLEKILSRLHDEIEPAEGGSDWRKRLEARLYKKGEQIRFAKGAADSGDMVTGALAGIGPEGELLIIPNGETVPLAFTAGELVTVTDSKLNRFI